MRVLRSTPGAELGRVRSPPAGSRSYLDATPPPGSSGYRVQAVDASGRILAQSALVTVDYA